MIAIATLLILATLISPSPSARCQGLSSIRIASEKERGEPLIVRGTLFASDGKTVVHGARIEVHQTDVDGYYWRGKGQNVPRLRGQLCTDAQGRYELRTIKPGSYPGEGAPAHIHFKVISPNGSESYLELMFEGDPDLTSEHLRDNPERGRFATIQPVRRMADRVLLVTRDLRLK